MHPTTEAEKSRRTDVRKGDRLDVVVPFTTLPLTQVALKEADEILGTHRNRVRILRVHELPIYLPADSTAIPIECLRGELLKLNAEHEFYGELLLTHDVDKSWADLVAPHRVLVIASKRRPWRTRQERFARRMSRLGHKVLVVYGE